MNRFTKIAKNGLFAENPTFVQLIGMCPTLATTTSVKNALGMGIASTFVLIGSNMAISLLRKFIPSKVRIASYIVVIAAFVTVIEMLLKAFLPSISNSLGMFIPLIVVNCIILARAESFASKNGVLESMADGLFMGLGFTMALSLLGAVREILGNGTIFDLPLFGSGFKPAIMFILQPGAFITLGTILAVKNAIALKRKGGSAK
ncbi:electron transport complex subunit RsxE [Qingrenia yutianensis]|uniref:Ion-translocating oxidoreductase complex subunit E n=1 Tax=Qingrenia yutianensis TaxID=2763676 RepID=A0A926FE24_9FIRM|nr:electron transport complex subunit E [Qingrenia yutianensis]MBC8597022.1 electron transport complex subunit E [Qingrenia yutianensis]